MADWLPYMVETYFGPSVCYVFTPAITNESLEGLRWNCSIILSTSKWTAELFFWVCLIQDGWLTAIYGRKLFWAITQYWIEILTSNFVWWYLKIKSYEFLSRSSNSRWLTDRHIWLKPILGHNLVLDWDIDFKFCAHSRSRVKEMISGHIEKKLVGMIS